MSLSLLSTPRHAPTLSEFRIAEPEEVIIEPTNRMEYLHQYFFIREYIYSRDLGLENFSGAEDAIDQYSHFIVARKGEFCFGGARLTISYADTPSILPLEHDEFRISKLFPRLAGVTYCELGRTALLPAYRSGEHLNAIFAAAIDLAINEGCKVFLGASPRVVARRFCTAFRQHGYPAMVHPTLAVPKQAVHEGIDLSFLIGSLDPSCDLQQFL
ncbi:MAG: hypothetical protein K2Q12_05835 [Rickettsiales bacterium]|nr:hypothetical protein [Rickettsiales bacterium]